MIAFAMNTLKDILTLEILKPRLNTFTATINILSQVKSDEDRSYKCPSP